MKSILIALLCVLCGQSPAADEPDFIYFMADDLGYADVGFNGCKDVPTPHLDKLAASGAILSQYYVQHVCSPTRAALLTGRYPIRYGLQQGVIRPGDKCGLPLAERTLSLALREAGYTTAITGKWHLGEFDPAYLPTRRGFDIQYGHFFGALDYTTHLRGEKRDWYRNDQPNDEKGYTTRLLAKEAARIVNGQPKDKPLFLYVPFNAVHSPYHTAPGREKDFAGLPKARREFATMLSEMDTAIGDILAALDASGRRENALIVFSSDNGGIGPATNGPLRGRKGTSYEGGHRVAACVSWAGKIKAGTTIAEPLHVVDWFPTLAKLAGIPVDAAHQKRPFDGSDILPVLTEGAKSPHDAILIHHDPASSALRMGDWKLVQHYATNRPRKAAAASTELYNLAADRGEQNNLAAKEPEKLAEMSAKLEEFKKGAIEPRSDPTGIEPPRIAHKPNVLLICVDDLKPIAGCYGGQAKTPHLDELAKCGVLFERAYCNQAVCAPSRNSLMTGRRPQSLGIYDLGTNFRRAEPDAMTLPQHFKASGWRTEGMGKILHVGHGNHEDPASWSVPHFQAKSIAYQLPQSSAGDGLTREEALFANKSAQGLPRGAAFESADAADDAYPDGRIASEAIARLKAAKGRADSPFFLAVGFLKPHLPFCAPKKYWDLYDRASFKLPERRTPPDGAPAYAPTGWGELRQYKDMPDSGPLDDEKALTLIHAYHAATSYADAQMGKVLAALSETGLAKNTVIILWGDHGWHLGDHGLWCKHSNYEQAARIPLIVAGAGIAPGRSQAFVETVDIFPTLCELAGLSAPAPMDGRSFAAALRDVSKAHREFIQHVYPRGERLGRAVRDGRYRLVEWKKPGAPADTAELELYDYETDPLETRNLAAAQPEVTAKLRALLAKEPEAKPQWRSADAKPKTDRAALFATKDTNKDGRLTRDEFLANQPDPDAAPARFTKFDADKDGELSRDEFIHQVTATKP